MNIAATHAETLLSLRADRSGDLDLEALRPAALRAGRLAEALFGALEADVVLVHGGKVWRGKPAGPMHDDVAATEIATMSETLFWLEDTWSDSKWRDHPQAQGPSGIRFCASAPIRLKSGLRLGVLRVFDTRPRAFDSVLGARLTDLAGVVADECDRLINQETWILRELFEQSPSFMAVLEGPDYICQMANPACIALIGQRAMLGLPARDVMPEFSGRGFLPLLDAVFSTGRTHVGQGAPIKIERQPGRPDLLYVDFVLQPITDAAGNVTSIFLQGNDVTSEKRSLEALESSRAALEISLAANQSIFDSSVDVICAINADGEFIQVSRSAGALWGYSADEMVGRRVMDFVHPDDREATATLNEQLRGEGKSTTAFQNRYLHKDGSFVPVTWSAVWSPRHQAIFAIARDMRESIAAEEKLRHAQKMEAIGRLTGGIAHDFNNLLTVIIGGAETLVDENPDRPAVWDIAGMIRQAGERGSDLTRQLLAFARRQPLEPRAIQVNDLILGMTGLLRRTLGDDIEMLTIPADAASLAMADPAQLESAILNLAINARDAMPSGGKLTIETANVAIDATYPRENDDIAIGDYLLIAVTDTGEGMSAQTISQAFEPFFTTKPPGEGTGLGLSMVHGFVKQSKGNVKIYSELGVGTTVKIYLPKAVNGGANAVTDGTHGGLPFGNEHIVLVEDDSLLREHGRKQLESLGYRVSAASNGPAALQMLDGLGPFDLLFTDVVMPGGMNGRQLADQVRTRNPGLKVLYTSGYTENAIVHNGRLDAGIDLLHKPYRKRDLAFKVRAVLDEEAG